MAAYAASAARSAVDDGDVHSGEFTMITRTTMFTVGSILAAALLAAGCSSSDSTTSTGSNTDAGTSSAKDSGSTTTPDSGGTVADTGTTTTKDSSTPPPDDSTCGPQGGQACQGCCIQNHPNSTQTLFGSLLQCACKPGQCATDCAASACGPEAGAPDTACQTCIANDLGTDAGQSCLAAGACAKDPDCAKLLGCLVTCN